jgi:hypothetical protein
VRGSCKLQCLKEVSIEYFLFLGLVQESTQIQMESGAAGTWSRRIPLVLAKALPKTACRFFVYVLLYTVRHIGLQMSAFHYFFCAEGGSKPLIRR